jgi:uncharacterized membrane protein YhaH (DUF805 family)
MEKLRRLAILLASVSVSVGLVASFLSLWSAKELDETVEKDRLSFSIVEHVCSNKRTALERTQCQRDDVEWARRQLRSSESRQAIYRNDAGQFLFAGFAGAGFVGLTFIAVAYVIGSRGASTNAGANPFIEDKPQSINTSARALVWKAAINWNGFHGRASRPEYWWTLLSFTILISLIEQLGSAAGAGFGQSNAQGFLALLLILAAGFSLVVIASVTVRRLHDVDRAGPWAILILCLPIFGGLLGIVWLTKKGDAYENRFGPPN